MNEPHRWKDGADASPAVRDLFASARRSRPMTSAERRRSAGRVANLVSVPVAASVVWVWAKGLAIAGVATLSAVTVAKVSTGDVQTPAMFASAPATTAQAGVSGSLHHRGVDAAIAERLLPAPNPEPASPVAASDNAPPVAPASDTAVPGRHPRRAAPAPAPAAAPAAPESDSLEKEASLLEAARGALATDPAHALSLLDRHAAEFPRGQLVSERSVMRVDALRRLGRLDEAQSDGQALLHSEARIYAPRVRKMIEPGTPAAPPVAPPVAPAITPDR